MYMYILFLTMYKAFLRKKSEVSYNFITNHWIFIILKLYFPKIEISVCASLFPD